MEAEIRIFHDSHAVPTSSVMRLQKFLAQAGVGSRRAAEELIRQGRVEVNGEKAELGLSVDPLKDRIRLDGKPVTLQTQRILIAFNKPARLRNHRIRSPGPQDRPGFSPRFRSRGFFQWAGSTTTPKDFFCSPMMGSLPIVSFIPGMEYLKYMM